MLGLRLACIELEPGVERQLIDLLYRATWAGGPGIEDPSIVASLLREAKLDAEVLIAAASSPEVKQRLITNGEAAIVNDVFWGPHDDRGRRAVLG